MTSPSDHRAALWHATAPPAPLTVPLTGSRHVDVLVVGAGVTGLAAALELAKRRVSCVVLEAGEIGSGAIGRSSGFVNAGMWVPPEKIRNVLGEERGNHLLKVLGEAPGMVFSTINEHHISCELVQKGTLQAAVGLESLREVEARTKTWLACGADVALLDARETADRTGTSYFAGALLDKRTGTIQPLAYVLGLATTALRAGAAIHTSSPVISYRGSAKGWTAITPHGEVTADYVLLSTDTYALHDSHGGATEFVNLPYFNVATEPLNGAELETVLASKQGVTDTNRVPGSYRHDANGRLIIGSVGSLNGLGGNLHVAWARRTIRNLFPTLQQKKLQYQWFGKIGLTNNHIPAIHRPAPRLLIVGGYNGRGIAAGTVFGFSIAQFLSGACNESSLPVPLTPIDRASLARMRELGLEWSARAYHFVTAR